MKRLSLVFTILWLSTTIVFAQYYYLPYLNYPGNPGGVNSDNEYPVASLNGWTSIHAGSASTPAWTSVQSIPFSFSFNGISILFHSDFDNFCCSKSILYVIYLLLYINLLNQGKIITSKGSCAPLKPLAKKNIYIVEILKMGKLIP